ncbi:hypothetical protein P3682_25280, partial [Vibrio parahaemolyticus]|nr:hypothetical protein [Vibrio parahaemolyticus]
IVLVPIDAVGVDDVPAAYGYQNQNGYRQYSCGAVGCVVHAYESEPVDLESVPTNRTLKLGVCAQCILRLLVG